MPLGNWPITYRNKNNELIIKVSKINYNIIDAASSVDILDAMINVIRQLAPIIEFIEQIT